MMGSVTQPDGRAREQPAQPVDATEKFGGLYDGFDAYRTVTEADYVSLLTEGLVVPDTNVFLNLYRYSEQTRTSLLTVLAALGDRLWVPRHVMVEFWRLRETVLLDPRDTDKTAKDLADRRDEALVAVRTWANRVGLAQEQRDEMSSTLSEAFQKVTASISDLADSDASQFATHTDKDPVLTGLEPILDGRVGLALDEAEHKKDLAEGLRRVQEKIPPGFKDTGKPGNAPAGDYLIWAQTLREAKARKRDVLFVTGDVKDDWWRREHGELRGPLPELAEELRKVAGTRLLMLRPESLAIHARRILNLDVLDESVEEIERVGEGENGGWTVEAVGQFLGRLSGEGWSLQDQAIRMAATQGGLIPRELVYSLGSLDKDRSLRGFTRPINRITQEFREQGIIAPSAIDILQTEYDPARGQPAGWATGFRIPEVLVPLVQEWHRTGDEEPQKSPPVLRWLEAIKEFTALGHDIDGAKPELDENGNAFWTCRNCGSTCSLTGPGGRWVSPTGSSSCPGRAQDRNPG
jgi:hypothetical protein